MNEMIKTIKEIHSKDVCMFKIGTFYHTYNRDSYILSYIFDYKIKELGANHKECGFPEVALPRVLARLEKEKINYVVLDRRNNYDVDSKEDYKKQNNYDKIFEKANKKINRQKRIDRLTNYLKENMDSEKFIEIIGKMEEVMYERGEV